MSTFDDYEPEDAWDISDDARDMAVNLLRRLDALDRSTLPSLDDLIGAIETRLGQYRRVYDRLDERQKLRVDMLTEDLPVLRERARHG